ncbi:MAG: crossover junction endodeoxyribonuclease RuvC [Chloroflexota bacterium]|nr:MAG: crossover junction endodeoxyribonuclease RuvC [Chloroflexota bacterium]
MVTLGIDPGVASTGYALVESRADQLALRDYGVVSTSAKSPLPERLGILYRELTQLIAAQHPDDVAIEELYFARNARSALVVGHARGVAILAAVNSGLPVSEYSPLQIKQAVSTYGRSDKAQVRNMVRMLLNLDFDPEPDHATDAMAAAICHINHTRWARAVVDADRRAL